MNNQYGCICCKSSKALASSAIENSPGLFALEYRIGTHALFKALMINALSNQAPLKGLTTRDDGDPAIALLDSWAVVLDVLSFYQERIANEGYLRTSKERRSILELAREIGYELDPGVAAQTYLAFTLDEMPGSPRLVSVDIGSKVQSIPGPGEKPQTFETVEKIDARPEWNAIKPMMKKSTILEPGSTEIYLKGITSGLKPGDRLLFIGKDRENDSESEHWDIRRVISATVDAMAGHTRVTWEKGLGHWSLRDYPGLDQPGVFVLRQKAGIFGHNAPEWLAMPDIVKEGYVEKGVDVKSIKQWPGFRVFSNGRRTGLFGQYFEDAGLENELTSRTDPNVSFTKGNDLLREKAKSARWTGFLRADSTGKCNFSLEFRGGARLWVGGQIFIDGWNASRSETSQIDKEKDLAEGELYDIRLEYRNIDGIIYISLNWSSPDQVSIEPIPESSLIPPTIQLDASYPQILPGSWLVLSVPGWEELYRVEDVTEDSQSDFTISAKVTRVTLSGENLKAFDNGRRKAAAFAQSEMLEIAMAPISDVIEDIDSIALDQEVDGLAKGQKVAIWGESPEGDQVGEVMTLAETKPAEELELHFTEKLKHSYKREKLRINANVALATHGETKYEVLGSGDASRPYQSFVLKQTPVTYISTPITGGSTSTIELKVNDILWDEVPTLYDMGPHDRVYTARMDDDGKITIQTGDGVHGSRLPKGAENVVARYRVGTGLEGAVKAGQLSLLMTRPLGLKEAINPTAATGAANSEHLIDARQNAPFTVLTLGRIVSVQDFEDFARAFAGIRKAKATWLWVGQRRQIHITVAAADGSTVDNSLKIYSNLKTAMDAARDPLPTFIVDSYEPVFFKLKARLRVRPGHDTEKVKASVISILEDTFSFRNREFGQQVFASEVMAAAQRAEGVEAVFLSLLYTGNDHDLKSQLQARTAWVDGSGKSNGAQLLILRREDIKLIEG